MEMDSYFAEKPKQEPKAFLSVNWFINIKYSNLGAD